MAPRADDETLIGQITNGLIAMEKTITSIFNGQKALLEVSNFHKERLDQLTARIELLEKKANNEQIQ